MGKKTSASEVKKLSIWGNHSVTQFPDVFHASVNDKPLRDALSQHIDWLDTDFLTKVQKRGGEIIEVSGKSSVASAANAICDHVSDLWAGTPNGQYSSMGVITDGNPYGIADDLIYSFPCIIKPGGEYQIV